jgi:hypothetical protein
MSDFLAVLGKTLLGIGCLAGIGFGIWGLGVVLSYAADLWRMLPAWSEHVLHAAAFVAAVLVLVWCYFIGSVVLRGDRD